MAEYVGGCGTTNKGVLLCTADSEGEAYYWETATVYHRGWAMVCRGVSFGDCGLLTYRDAVITSKPVVEVCGLLRIVLDCKEILMLLVWLV